MVYVCPEKDCAVQKPCEPCTCGMDRLPAFKTETDNRPAEVIIREDRDAWPY